MLREGTYVRRALFPHLRELRWISVLLPNLDATQSAGHHQPFFLNLRKINADGPSRRRPPNPARLMTTALTQLIPKLQVRSCYLSASNL